MRAEAKERSQSTQINFIPEDVLNCEIYQAVIQDYVGLTVNSQTPPKPPTKSNNCMFTVVWKLMIQTSLSWTNGLK